MTLSDMLARINKAADARERRLGTGYYSPELRGRAAELAAGWVELADQAGVTLGDLDNTVDVAVGALDAFQAAQRRTG